MPAKMEAPKINKKPNHVTRLGVIPVLANDVTMGLVTTAAKVFLITSSLAGDLLTWSEVEILRPPC